MNLLLALAVGAALGFGLRARHRLLRMVEQATNVTVFLLLFLLGIAVGADDALLADLGVLGGQALLLSLGGIAGSVALGAIFHARVLSPRQLHEE